MTLFFIFILSLLKQRYTFSILFPFGPINGDESMFLNDDQSLGPIHISTSFLFFNQTFESVYVNTNGILSFNRPIAEYRPRTFPIDNLVGIAPLWCDVDIRNGGQVYFREILDELQLNMIGNEIRLAFSNFINFRPTWAYIITWYKVAPYDGNFKNTNTFQTLILTNGRHSFTIFNYDNLMWSITSSSQNYASAGFNSGTNGRFYQLNGSLTSDVLNLSNGSNVNIQGKYIYRIDESSVQSGGCNREGLLTVSPLAVFYFGNQKISLSGPCFELNDSVKLIFDNNSDFPVECVVIDSKKSTCQVPILNRLGRIPIQMVINSNLTFSGFIISKEINENSEIKGLEPMYAIEEIDDEIIKLEWSQPLESDNQSSYRLYYSEIGHDKTTKTTILNTNLTGNSTFINLNQLKPTSSKTLNELSYIGHLYISKSENSLISYVKSVKFLIKSLASIACETWSYFQPDPLPYLKNLPPCWRFIRLNNGKFPPSIANYTIDPTCDPNTSYGSLSCGFYYPGSKACYRSTAFFTLNGHTAGQQCCYDSTGLLKVGPPGGGTLDLGHWRNAWDHLNKDVVPFFQCCKLSNNCDIYYKWRPSQDGTGWVAPGSGAGSGDPHFITLDGSEFTFNGYGEFIFLNVAETGFQIQVRIGPIVENGVVSEGTVFKAVAAKGLDMDSIQIDLNIFNRVEVFVDGFLLDMNEFADLNVINFSGVDLILGWFELSYAMQFSNGIRIEVKLSERKDALFLFTSVPSSLQNKTSGLMGNFDGNPNNDFILPNGTILPLDKNDDKEIFKNFGYAWQVNNSTTVFTYSNGYDYEFYQNISYTPKFLTDGVLFENRTLEELAKQKCGSNQNCLFDVSSTGQLGMAQLNNKFEETRETLNLMVNEAAKQCIPMKLNFSNGEYEETIVSNYLVFYTFKCNDGFRLEGNTSIKCENGTSLDDVSKCVESNIDNGVTKISIYNKLTVCLIFLGFFLFY